VLTGLGGGTLFVPIVGAFFPFHLDFVRGAGLLLALSGALSAGPSLMRGGFASLQLALPLAVIASVTSIAGALMGLALPTRIIETALGLIIFALAIFMWRGNKGEHRPAAVAADPWAAALRMNGVYHDPSVGHAVTWQVHRTGPAFAAFAAIGLIAGMFGIGAGWANVSVFHLLMGAPLKLSVGTSGLLLSVVDTSAAWVYLHRGAVLPLIVVPSIIGVMLGAKIGARLLPVAPTGVIRAAVIILLFFASARTLLRSFGI